MSGIDDLLAEIRAIVAPCDRGGIIFLNRLVRDRFPEILRRKNVEFSVISLGIDDPGDRENYDRLMRKCILEAAIALLIARGRSGRAQSLARLMSNIDAYLDWSEFDLDAIEDSVDRISRDEGGFSKRFLLIERGE